MDFASEIRSRVTVKQLCQVLGIEINRNGFGYCPFHADKKGRSLKVYDGPPSNFCCYGCHAAGSVIDFAMKYYGISFRQAVARLDSMFGLNLPLTRKRTIDERRAAEEARREQEEARRARQAAIDAQETHFWHCFSLYLDVRRVIDQGKPRGLETQISQDYADAVWRLPIVRDEYERAQDALIQLKEGRCKQDAASHEA